MKKSLFLLFLSFSIFGITQNSNTEKPFKEKLTQLKKENNLEEYLYTFFDEYIIDKNISFLQKATENLWRKPKNNTEEIAFLHIKVNIGYFYFNRGEISKSIKAYEKALLYYQNNNVLNYDIILYCLKPLANNYTRIGDYQRAEELYKYTLNIAQKENNYKAIIGTYTNLAILLQSTNKHNEAISLLKKALRLKHINNDQKTKLQTEIAKNYSLIGLYNKSLSILKKLDPNHQNEIIKGLCYFNKGDFKSAETHLEKAISFINETNSKREKAKTFNILAKIQIKNNKLTKALDTYNKSLQFLIINKNISDNLYAENTFLEIFDGKALVFTKQNKFENAIKNYQLSFEVEKLLQHTKSSQKGKIIQQKENRNRSEKIVSLYYQLYLKNQNQDYIKNAFKNVEQSKSMVLLEKLNYHTYQNKITKDSLLIRESYLQKKKAVFSKKIKIEELKHENANINLIKKLVYKKTIVTTQLEVLKEKIKKKYPFFKNGLDTISLSEIQKKLLHPNQQIIEFFDTQNAIFIFSITKNEPIKWRRIEKSEKFNQALQTYINLFVNNNGSQLKNNIKTYQETAYYLYRTLIKKELKESANLLTIIPDGKINFIAFDALLTKNKEYTSFENLAYLTYKKQLNYSYSVHHLILQKENSTQKLKTNSILGFFPYFENNYRGLQELTNTLEEEKIVASYKNSLVYDKKEATKNLFLKLVNDYEIIHLSTHASSGSFEIPAHIEFRDSTLYLPEIYGLNLQSNLLILSACETGIGKLQKGEGSMSLARGFSYTGVKNLIVSQWKVNDKSTSILMRYFYTNYKKTKNITDALNQAKIDYLQDKNIPNLKKTPYYWSGFQFIGNTQNSKSINYDYYIILLILVLLFIYHFYKRKQN